MKFVTLSATAMAAVLLAAAPAFAQSTPTGAMQNSPTAQKQPTDGADNPSNPREYEGAAEWHKQHTDGGAVEAADSTKQLTDGADNPSNPREYEGAAEWHKQHTDGGAVEAAERDKQLTQGSVNH